MYSFEEYSDMLLIYGEVQGNGNAAERLYAERFPNRRHPERHTFVRLLQRLRDTGTLNFLQEGRGVPRNVRTPEMEEEVLSRVAANPGSSTRSIANALNISHVSVWRILKNEKFHPYHIQKVQSLNAGDFDHRVNFCRWFLQKCEEIPEFPSRILFSDEATFTREGIWNNHNFHIWEQDNPHASRCNSFQRKIKINVWVGIFNNDFVGPFLLPPNLRGNNYLGFLQEILGNFLDDLPLNIRNNMWFQQDGAPAHYFGNVREHLNTTFNRRWIGRGGPVAWPPRSPDLTPIDFFAWGYVKNLIYGIEEPIETEEDLIARIMGAFEEIRTKQNIFRRVYRNMRRRCRKCIREGGRQFEQLL